MKTATIIRYAATSLRSDPNLMYMYLAVVILLLQAILKLGILVIGFEIPQS